MSESRTLPKGWRIRAGAWQGKGGLHSEETQVPREEGGKARRVSLGEVEGSMSGEWMQNLSRTICRVLVSVQVWPNLKQERRLGNKQPALKMTKRNESW